MFTQSSLNACSVDGASVLEVPDDVPSSDASFLPSVVSTLNINCYLIYALIDTCTVSHVFMHIVNVPNLLL